MNIPQIIPTMRARVEVIEWRAGEPLDPITGTVVMLTANVIVVREVLTGARWSWLREDVTTYQPWDERNHS
jgi:hypothetical protein